MTPERLREVEALFHEARERAPAERNAFLAQACGDDSALRRDVESLLTQPIAGLIDAPVAALAARLLGPSAREAETGGPVLNDGPLDDARFAPGHMFAARFRIVSLLGRGGMGEVYRAEDLRLGRAVALKLLTAGGSKRLDRFVSEVRLAREITHPNVCRVYDIGHAEGWDYLSMEYVDGETLASLLQRIGRLPDEKALDVARQLCAGLIAAHERGVLHRDLKPSNIMLDSRGRARIMDFGLAVEAGETRIPERAGTPAYMAPEQVADERVTERTDVYTLGLVLFELFTGRMVFPVSKVEERLRLSAATVIARASPDGISEPIHTMICRCLEADPAKRPSSISVVAATLPGGDSLSAALAVGRVPSPEMVAAAQRTGGLRPAAAWLLVAGVLCGALGVAWQAHIITELRPSGLPKPPEVLADRARTILGKVGGERLAADSAFWFKSTAVAARGVSSQSAPGLAVEGDRASFPLWFVYRESPQYLVPQNPFHVITETDPPADAAGMTDVILDPRGRLIYFKRILDQPIRSFPASANGDWATLFSDAGLDIERFVRIEAPVVSPVPHDRRFAWDSRPSRSQDHVRIVGAALAGMPVYFEDLTAGATSIERRSWFLPSRPAWTEFLLLGVVIGALAGAVFLARRNLGSGEGDPQGARKLSAVAGCGIVVWTLLAAHHVPIVADEWRLIELTLVSAVGWAAFVWLMYVGLEPHVRRWWPATLIAWTRFMSGRVRDPIVGRELLAGLLAGVVVDALLLLRFELAHRAGLNLAPYNTALDPRFNPLLESLRSGRHFAGVLTFLTLDALEFAVGGLFLLVLIRMLVRKPWLAIVVWTLVGSVLNLLAGGSFGSVLPFAAATAAVAAVVLLRFGLLSFAVMLFCSRLLARLPLTLDQGAWYAGITVMTLVLIAAIAIYGLITALAWRPGRPVPPSFRHFSASNNIE